ncbi:hypothetical protein COLO4_31258 [Corchorus olitorius]|uniref:Uncharacterized protein n=1 Tax=Corchorus olitorius TaxID=93759 RepID=A0A1R3H4Y7_9ROSI|nr:hypothetical protein COLO4_31258 [Corchorus olitorius]
MGKEQDEELFCRGRLQPQTGIKELPAAINGEGTGSENYADQSNDDEKATQWS